jgi:GNAT superfamily N-acetyltransferase
MKAVKLKNVPNKRAVLQWLIGVVKADKANSGNWPLAQPINLPTEEFYVVMRDGETIPAYLYVKNHEALVLWVSESHRKQGYARFLLNSLNVKYTVAHEPSLKFWESLGFKRLSHGNGPIEMKR